MHTRPSPRRLLAVTLVGLALSACGTDAPTSDTTTGDTTTGDTTTGDTTSHGGAGGSTSMCAPEVVDCVDADLGDERLMAPTITIVDAFVDPSTSGVETAPGSVAEPFRLFLQEAIVDGATVTVSFSGGEAPCFVVDRVEVVEDDRHVAVGVWAGQPDPDADCDQQGTSMQAVAVELSEPLGDRELVDASRTATDPNATY